MDERVRLDVEDPWCLWGEFYLAPSHAPFSDASCAPTVRRVDRRPHDCGSQGMSSSCCHITL